MSTVRRAVSNTLRSRHLNLPPTHIHVLRRALQTAVAASVVSSSSLTKAKEGVSPSTALKNPLFAPLDTFARRHIGLSDGDIKVMLDILGYDSVEAFIAECVPPHIRLASPSESALPDFEAVTGIPSMSETELFKRARELAGLNKPYKSYIGLGYHNAVVPAVILRSVMENPAWYTPYTPYQPEIAQGRLESLVNFQTMIMSLSSMDIANASLLDEATAAAEAMAMAFAASNMKKRVFVVSSDVLPQTLSVLRTRAKGFGIIIKEGDVTELLQDENIKKDLCGVLIQYPNADGRIRDFSALAKDVHTANPNALVACATDLLALTMLKPPGEWGADVVLGNSARFGVPAGYGGPHAAFFACTEKLKRRMPGRLVGRSRDVEGKPAYRLALQTREQHIRREKATSNICTSQALLANMAAMYAVYHGPEGLKNIAQKVHTYTNILKKRVEEMGYRAVNGDAFFDTLTIDASNIGGKAAAVHAAANEARINLREIDEQTVGVSLDESVSGEDLVALINVFARSAGVPTVTLSSLSSSSDLVSDASGIPQTLQRTSEFLPHSVFNTHHSETEMLRYITHLQSKDLGLSHAMIPLGSCTMKLNSTSSMIPLTFSEFSHVHPFAPVDQVQGYFQVIKELETDLCKITGFAACSLQPNSGAAGEYAGLTAIRAYHRDRNEGDRDICLIPVSAHGTNPASAVMAGLKVVPVKVHSDGSLDIADLREKAEKHKDKLAACMITYPSTYGVFEAGVQEACSIVHENGGQVYIDGANLNAQIGLTNPATCGGDVCHMNLHKTFAIPHGGGGPGVGPICVAKHLAPFLPQHPLLVDLSRGTIKGESDTVSAAPFGSASILLISWAYIKMLGSTGLAASTRAALLSANYIAHRLAPYYTVRFTNSKKRVAHEVLLDLADLDRLAGIKVNDVAKRLQDYGFHPPTCSWPLGTAMLIEPTESESLQEVDRFCEAMIEIRREVQEIADGKMPKDVNLLKGAPHPVSALLKGEGEETGADGGWKRPYSRERAAYPLPWLKEKKFWPTVGRIDDAYGDLNLVCDCPSVEEVVASS